MRIHRLITVVVLAILAGSPIVAADPQPVDTSRGDRLIADYFRAETRRLTRRSLAIVETLEDWTSRRGRYRRQLFEMLGLQPLPKRTPLKPVVTGRVEQDEFVVENLHFQSRPGLYVTGNFYLPKEHDGPLPAILYVCGHGRVKKDGVSYGNKVHYQHHGAWFARNGYACLTIDTLQLGEIEGIHHGTYNHDMWWWNARGYTPAGVEAWNCIRALDYLETRPEVDAERIGVTGRSGGGAYSWWIATLDDRIKAAVPVAGITSLKNHVVDGTVEGHCDCMFPVNTYRWDFAQVAALVAPRPLLISNSDKDGIFPLDGVVDVYFKTRHIYDLYDATDKLGLQITEGPHKDTQELRVHAFHWMNRFLKDEDPLIETTAVPFFEPEQLKVFDELPEDERNTTVHEWFTRKAPQPPPPDSKQAWEKQRDRWLTALRRKSFRGWPNRAQVGGKPAPESIYSIGGDGTRLTIYRFTSQQHVPLRLYLVEPKGTDRTELDEVVLHITDQDEWENFHSSLHSAFPIKLPDENPQGEPRPDAAEWFRSLVADGETKRAVAWVAPRGIGPTEWSRDERDRTQIRRRFVLLGQTRDGMRVWDARRAVQALRQLEGLGEVPLCLKGKRQTAGVALYASLFESHVHRLELWNLPQSHREGPIFLNVLRFLDVPQAVAMTAERAPILLHQDGESGWEYPQAVAQALGWGGERVQVRATSTEKTAEQSGQ